MDYYDLPADLLPSSNFANRPSNEISDITFVDDLWTFMSSSSPSSASSSDTEEPPTPRCQTSTEPQRHELASTDNPNTTVTGQYDDRPRVPIRNSSGEFRVVQRPHHKKAASIPQTTIAQNTRMSNLPRRSPGAKSGIPKGRILPQKQVAVDPVTGKRSFVDPPLAQLVQKPPPSDSPPKAPRPGTDGKETVKSEIQEASSFSRTARVRKTLEDRNVASLTTNTMDLRSHVRSSSPSSMVETPRELYHKAQWQPKRQSDPCPRLDRSRSPELGRPESSPTVSHTVEQSLGESVSATGVEQVNIVPAQRVYLPGAICLESCGEKRRRDSVASLDLFQESIAFNREKFFDLVGLDDIGTYFEDLGVIEETSDKCLDRYWMKERQETRQCAATSTSVKELAVTRRSWNLTDTQNRQSATFSYCSESSNASQPRSWTAKRQRIKLRKLLSPGFPGSVFGKSLHREN